VLTTDPCNSFALCVYEIYAARVPFLGLNPMAVTQQVAKDGKRPSMGHIKEGSMAQGMQDMMTKCWDQDPDNRPDFVKVIAFMTKFMDANGYAVPSAEDDAAITTTLAHAGPE